MSPRTSGAPVVSTIEDVGAALVTVLALAVRLLAFAVTVAVVIWAVVVVRPLRRRRARAGQS